MKNSLHNQKWQTKPKLQNVLGEYLSDHLQNKFSIVSKSTECTVLALIISESETIPSNVEPVDRVLEDSF